MKKTSKILAIILSVILCMSALAFSVMAENAEQSGLKLTLTTDKAEYTADEQILVTLKVENLSETAINNVALKIQSPAALSLKAGQATNTLSTLAAGASNTIEATYLLDKAPNTGDNTQIVVILAMLAVGAIAVLMVVNRKTRCVALALVMVLGIAVMGMPASAANETYDLAVTTTIKVDNQNMTLTATANWTAETSGNVHTCEHACAECGKCKDEACDQAACASKCACTKLLYSQDFTAQPTDDLGNYVSVENGVANVTANNVLFWLPVNQWLDTNAYEISFDMAFSGTSEQMFIHLPGLNSTDPNVNVYLAIQGDGYMCLNCWYEGNWRLVYNFNTFFGGANANPLVWGTDMHAFRIVILGDAIELWIDNVKYLSTNLSAFGGLTNGNPANASANIPVGPLAGIGFHPLAPNVFKMDNLIVKEIKAGKDPVVLEDDTALPNLPIAAPNNSAVNFAHDNYKVEATFDVIGEAAIYTNACMLLVGANGVTGCIDAVGATSINVQLNVNGDGTATPVMYHYTPTAGWLGVNGTTITLPTEGTLTMKFVSCGDKIFWYINDALVLSTTYSANGMIANHICSLGLFEIAGALEYSTYTYTALTEAEIAQYSKLA